MAGLITGWEFGRSPRIIFGPGAFSRLGEEAASLGRRALLVTGKSSLLRSGRLEALSRELRGRSLEMHRLEVGGEPSPELVDGAVLSHRGLGIDLVIAVGGGSVLDAGKAVAAMLPLGAPVEDYLEGVGKEPHPGIRLPFIAVPTTAGTGSEATNNAVISRVGKEGFKRSLRHPFFFPDLAVVDPELTLTCPPEITAACGMDALTQLLESYLSPRSGPLTDALALSGMEKVREGLLAAYHDGSNLEARTDMSYAALVSGMTISSSGVGLVHGFASAIGGRFPIPHGVICGTLLAAVTRANLEALSRDPGGGTVFLEKYAKAGRVLTGKRAKDTGEGCRLLLETLEEWTEEMRLPRLGTFGLGEEDLRELAGEASLKDNPVRLEAEERFAVLAARL
ncbi:iron-containing alcohol dehydrogenase [Candidatus Solincola sp.]|nr:iron-containing alcohol dehydrogenase [Actinomycetota bacterium]MDI7251339.1 iron-containing alcohol dehydrogenase [Actinomycetota bacterium]